MHHDVNTVFDGGICFLTDFLPTLEVKMNPTTYDYNYDSYYDDQFTPCSPEAGDHLGAQLSILYYFMFLFSLFGNGLVLVIIHR